MAAPSTGPLGIAMKRAQLVAGQAVLFTASTGLWFVFVVGTIRALG